MVDGAGCEIGINRVNRKEEVMEKKAKIWCVGLAVLITFVVLGNATAQNVDELLAPYENGEREFVRQEIGDLIVYFHQRMVGDAVVEKDFIVYQFDKETKKLAKEIVNWREDVPEAVPPGELFSQEDAEALAEGEVQFSELYIISPESDVFPLDPTPTNPCWVVRSVVDGTQVVSIIDAVTGEFLGNGIAPPWEGFSLGGPNWGSCAEYYYDPWATNARGHFNDLGYPTYAANNPSDATVRSFIQTPSVLLFYELAHGSAYSFHNICPDTESITAGEVESWIASYRKMPFVFLGSCGGMCNTGNNTLSYEFRKGSSSSATTVGYCGMAESYCASCWSNSINWQNRFFYYVKLGWTIKAATDRALADYPMCNPTSPCMRFAGDSYFRLGSRDEIMGVGGSWTSGTWYRNLASETWHRTYSYTPNGAIALGDTTRDGREDMISLWSSGMWYQNPATLGWTRVYSIAPYRVTAGDLNGDGRAELIGTWVNGMFYFYWTGSSWNWSKMYDSIPSGEIAAGDFDRDGRAEVASCWGSGLWYQDGSTLGWTKVYSKAPGQLAAGDITGDGRDELIGYGGTWSPGIWYKNQGTGLWYKPYSITPSGDLAAGDVTGDRRADMISVWGSGLWYQNGRTWGWTREYSKAPNRIAAGDITGN